MKIFRNNTKIMLCVFLLISLLTGCSKKEIQTNDLGVMHEEEFGGVYLDMTIDDFNALGFNYGDGVTVVFSNGYTLEDIPYYNGYYTKIGEALLVAYPGYPHIKVGINNGADLWTIAQLNESDTAKVTLSKAKEYQDIQDARDIAYYDERERYDSDVIFANFRNVSVGEIKEGILYRSASPCNNEHNRASYVDKLIAEAGVNYIVNLADNETKINNYIAGDDFNSPYFLSLYNDNKVIPLALNMNFEDDYFKGQTVLGLKAMIENEGPYLVHCTEGKDRTGFVCLLLEMLGGASYEEMVDDYMITYDNYYGIKKDDSKYDVIVSDVFDPMLYSIIGDESVKLDAIDLQSYAEKYLLDIGLNDEEIGLLRNRLVE